MREAGDRWIRLNGREKIAGDFKSLRRERISDAHRLDSKWP